MADKKDYISKAIAAELAPFLAGEGFVRLKPKHFVRLQGDLIHSITFQISQYGDRTFYVHYAVNFLYSPKMDINAYRIGDRINHAPEGCADWVGDSEETALAAIAGVVYAAKDTILPWFAKIKDVRDFIIEWVANPQASIESLDLAAALLRAGYLDRAWWICQALSQESAYIPPIGEWDRTSMALATELMNAIDSKESNQLLGKWKRENIEVNKLVQLFSPEHSKKQKV